MTGPLGDVSKLSPAEKRQLLKKLLKERAEFHPLSYGQRGLWYIHQLSPDSAAYNTGFAARILSSVSPATLQRTFQTLIERHPALRTTFLIREGQLIQRIHAEVNFSLECIDASGWNEILLRERVQKAYELPFHLERGPLLRVVLFSLSPMDHVLVLAIHHIVFDGWSFWVLLDELRLLCDSERSGSPLALPLLEATYADFIDWERKMVAGPVGERHRAYWENQLAGELPVLELGADRPRPPHQVFEGHSLVFKIRNGLAQKLRELARIEGVTVYTVLLAAFKVLLYRYSGQDDVLVGSPTSGRSRPEFSEVIGDFVNIVVLRSKPVASLSFLEFLQQVNRTVLEALEHQEYPFPLLVEKLTSARNPGHSPIFQTSFVFHKAQRSDRLLALLDSEDPAIRIDWGGLLLSPYPLSQQAGQFDLTLEIADKSDHMMGTLKYNTALFDEATAERMRANFEVLLEGIAADASQKLAGLPMLAGPERKPSDAQSKGRHCSELGDDRDVFLL
jgi:Condensation domain